MMNVGEVAYVVWQSPAHMFRCVKVKIIYADWVYTDKITRDRKHLEIACDENGALYANTYKYDSVYYDENGNVIKPNPGTSICCTFYSEAELKCLIKNTMKTNDEIIESMKRENASLSVIAHKFKIDLEWDSCAVSFLFTFKMRLH